MAYGITPEWSSAEYGLDNLPDSADLDGWAQAANNAREALAASDYDGWVDLVLAQLPYDERAQMERILRRGSGRR